MVFFQMNTE